MLAFCLSITVAGCGERQVQKNELDRIVERESLYRDLAGLESGLADGALAGLSSVDDIRSDLVFRRPFAISPAQFEISRNRRTLAFEQLSALTAPMTGASDQSAFWEIHQAYRNAVETGLSGHGKIGLVYSRPFPADHLSNPMMALMNAVSGRSGRIAPGDADVIQRGFRSTTRRLDLALAAGHLPPLSSIERMIAQVEASPFKDEQTLMAFRDSLLASETDETKVFDPGVRSLLTANLLKEVALYADILSQMQSSGTQSNQQPATDRKFLNASMRQTTSGIYTPESCYSAAGRLASSIEAELKGVLDAVETDLPNQTSLADKPIKERFAAWVLRSDLFEVVDDESLISPTDVSPFQTPETPKSAEFLAVLEALETLKAEWKILFSRSFPEPSYSESEFLPRQRRIRATKQLTYSELETGLRGGVYDIAHPQLIDIPVSSAVIDLLMAHSPGAELARKAKRDREDRPALSRKLPSMGFDLGWPHYVVALMADRGAFETAPRLNAVRLYRALQVVTEAEIETGLMTETITTDQAAVLLMSRVGANEVDVGNILARLSVEPSLACAEMAGFQKLQSLKARAEGVLGAKFNIREFNDVVLTAGSRPLFVVENDVDDWISEKAGLSEDKTLPE